MPSQSIDISPEKSLESTTSLNNPLPLAQFAIRLSDAGLALRLDQLQQRIPITEVAHLALRHQLDAPTPFTLTIAQLRRPHTNREKVLG